MSDTISREQLFTWCRIPAEKLPGHPDLKAELVVRPSTEEIMKLIGAMMAEELIENNKAGRPTKWVLPAGPTREYDFLIDRVNKEGISLKNLWVFHMDEFLDWEGRPFPVGDTYESLEGTMNACFYDRVDKALAVPENQRVWPRINDLDAPDELCEKLGGIDTVWAGVGCKGLVAFNEQPRSYTYRVSVEEYAKSRTRIVDLNEDTIVALSQRTFGGCYDRVPPRAVTIGFKIMLSAKRAVCMITTGSWKQTTVRVLLFSDAALEYPVTLFTKYIPKVMVLCNDETVDHPLSHEIRGW